MFRARSDKKELLDQDQIPVADLYQNLKELDIINHLLGGYKITISALEKVLLKEKVHTLVDIGSGGGDTLKRIHKWNQKQGYKIQLTGIDLKQVCIDYAMQNNPNSDIHFICDDYKNLSSHLSDVSVIHACLFCHHLKEEEIIKLIQFAIDMKSILIINDLERHPFAYYSIKFITQLFSKSYLVKNDAPLSVLRGFKKSEWQNIISASGAKKYSLRKKWAFRHEVIVYAGE